MRTTTRLFPAKVVQMYKSNPPDSANSRFRNLICADAKGWHIIPFDDISHCTAHGSYATVFFNNEQSVLISKTLSALESLLPTAQFVRVHQSHIVALERIRMFSGNEIQLGTGHNIPVSRSRMQALKELILNTGARLE